MTEHPERERLAQTDWRLVHGVTCVVCPGCNFTFDAFHTDDTPEGGYSCPDPKCTEYMLRPEAASPPEGREGRGALDISDKSCREVMDLYAVSSNWGEAMVATLAAEVLRLRARAAPVDRGLVERPTPDSLRAAAQWFEDEKVGHIVQLKYGGGYYHPSFLLRRIAFAIERAALERAPEARAGEVT